MSGGKGEWLQRNSMRSFLGSDGTLSLVLKLKKLCYQNRSKIYHTIIWKTILKRHEPKIWIERRQQQTNDFNKLLENWKQMEYDWAEQRKLQSRGTTRWIPVRSMLTDSTVPEQLRFGSKSYSKEWRQGQAWKCLVESTYNRMAWSPKFSALLLLAIKIWSLTSTTVSHRWKTREFLSGEINGRQLSGRNMERDRYKEVCVKWKSGGEMEDKEEAELKAVRNRTSLDPFKYCPQTQSFQIVFWVSSYIAKTSQK